MRNVEGAVGIAGFASQASVAAPGARLPNCRCLWPCPGQGSPSWGGAGAVALVAQGAHGSGCLGQSLSCMVTAGALGLTLPWGLRLRWEWALRVLLHHLGACTGSSPALRAVVLFHWGSYLLLKQACNWTCISQCISQWIALHIASHVWIQTHDLLDESS